MLRLTKLLIIFLVLVSSSSLPATTIVPFTDADLVDKAPVILLGRVVGKLPNTTERAVTDWLVSVDRVLKGAAPSGAITVRVLGGETPQGEILKIYGAPDFQDGEDVLLFLYENRGRDPYEIFQFVQGAFHKVWLVGTGLRNLQWKGIRPDCRSGHDHKQRNRLCISICKQSKQVHGATVRPRTWTYLGDISFE